MGVEPKWGPGVVRFSVGRFTTRSDVDAAADALLRALKR
jgi:cysteine sulfinate desulfinase/cysteine desulfurase-like protein